MFSNENEILSLGLAERPENILWYFDDIPFSQRTNQKQKFSRKLSQVQRTPLTLAEEAVLAAQKIREKNPGKITILASGGSDSEFVMRAFLKAQIPFEIVAIDFSTLNVDELQYLEQFCRQQGLTYKKVQLDIERFWENELEAIALEAGSVSPQICAILHVISQLDNYVVIGDGEIDIFQQSTRFYDTWGEKWAYASWMLKKRHPGCPAFFSYTSELEASMYLDPIVDDFIHEGWAYMRQSRFHVIKPFYYYHHLGLRFRPKIDIFRPIREADNQWRKFLAEKMPGADSYFSIEFDLIKHMKMGTVGDRRVQLLRLHDLPPAERIRFLEPTGGGEHWIQRWR